MIERSPRINYLAYLRRKTRQNQASPFLFAYSRTALRFGIKGLNLPREAQVLVPAYICDAVLHPLEELGLVPVFYETGPSLAPLWEKLETLVTTQIKALFMVHYFGIAQEIERFQEFCTRHKLALIEDNANGFCSTYKGQPMGTFGDIGVISPWKSLPILNGSLLYTKHTILLENLEGPMPVNAPVQQLKSLGGQVIKEILPLKKAVFKSHNYDKLEDLTSPHVHPWTMDDYSYRIIVNTDSKAVIKKRQEIYTIWQEWTGKQGLIPVFSGDLGENAPLVYPAYAENEKIRNLWFSWGFNHKIDIHSWPTLPEAVRQPGGEAMEKWKKMTCFPIHQGINPLLLERILKKLPAPQ